MVHKVSLGYSPECRNFIKQRVQHRYVSFQWRVIWFKFLLNCWQAHVEKSWDFSIASYAVPFWKIKHESSGSVTH